MPRLRFDDNLSLELIMPSNRPSGTGPLCLSTQARLATIVVSLRDKNLAPFSRGFTPEAQLVALILFAFTIVVVRVLGYGWGPITGMGGSFARTTWKRPRTGTM